MENGKYVAALGTIFLMLASSLGGVFLYLGEDGSFHVPEEIRPPGIDIEMPFIYQDSDIRDGITVNGSLLLNVSGEELRFLADLEGKKDFRVNSTSQADRLYGDDLGDMAVNPMGADKAEEREVEEGDIVRSVGSHLYILNPYRGLIIMDMSRPDDPVIAGAVRIAGYPVEMYVEDGFAYVLVKRDYSYWNRYYYMYGEVEPFQRTIGTGLLIIDVHSPSDPKIERSLAIEGFALGSRRVGEVIYIVSSVYSWYGGGNDSVVVTSVNMEDLAGVDRVAFPGTSYQIHVSPAAIYVSDSSYVRWDEGYMQRTNITYVDISDPRGDIRVKGTLTLPGSLYDRYQFDEYRDTLRVVTHFWSNGSSVLWVADISDPDDMGVIGSLAIDDAGGLMATRFDGDRAYTIHLPRSIDPLDVIDLSDPTDPELCDVLEMPGWVTHMEVRGDSIIAIGVDNTDGWKAAVSLFDVSDPYNAVLEDRVTLGGSYSSSGANWDPKRLTVLDDDGLVVIPFSQYDGYTYRSTRGVQLVSFDLASGDLELEGSVVTRAEALRTRRIGERLVSMSTYSLEVIDDTDPARPEVTAVVELCSNDRGLFEFGDGLVRISSDHYVDETRISPLDPNGAGSPLALKGTYIDAVQYGEILYVMISEREVIFNEIDTTYPAYRYLYHIYSIDCSEPRRPTVIGERTILDSDGVPGHYYYASLFRSGDRVGYFVGTDRYAGDYRYSMTVSVLDTASPGTLSVLGTYAFDVGNWVQVRKVVGDIAYFQYRSHTYLYDGNYYNYTYVDRLARVDMGDPANLVRLDDLEIPGLFAGAKKDGSYIYTYDVYPGYGIWYLEYDGGISASDNGTFYILSTSGGSAEVVRAIDMPWRIRSVFIEGDNATLISARSDHYYWLGLPSKDASGTNQFRVWRLDLADPEHPKLTANFRGSGVYNTAAVTGDLVVVCINSCEIAIYRFDTHGAHLEGAYHRFGWTNTFRQFSGVLYHVAGYYGIIGYPLG